MTSTTRIFFILAAFFFLDATLYVLWGLYFAPTYTAQAAIGEATGQVEWVGTVVIGLCAVLSAFIGFYLHRVHGAQSDELPEDRDDALIDDGEAEQGFFSPWSWWPVCLAASAALMFVGLAVGNWLCFIAVPLAAISVVGLIFEYQRGYFGH